MSVISHCFLVRTRIWI